MGDSPAVIWPFLPFHPKSSPGGLSHDGTADGRIVGAADIPRYEWMYRPTQGELAKVRAAGSYPRFPNWRNVAKSIVDPEASGATEIDIREILSRLPDAPDEERLPSHEWLLEHIQQCLVAATDGGLMNDDSQPVILNNRVREIWNLMRKLNIFPRPSEPEDLSTVTKCRVALDDAERAVRHYVCNVASEDSEKVQSEKTETKKRGKPRKKVAKGTLEAELEKLYNRNLNIGPIGALEELKQDEESAPNKKLSNLVYRRVRRRQERENAM